MAHAHSLESKGREAPQEQGIFELHLGPELQPFGAQSSMAPRLWTRPSGMRMLDDSPVQPVSCGMVVEGTACLSAHVRPESYEVQPSE